MSNNVLVVSGRRINDGRIKAGYRANPVKEITDNTSRVNRAVMT